MEENEWKVEEKNRCNSLDERDKNQSFNKENDGKINFVEIQKETEKAKKFLNPITNLMEKIKKDYYISLDQKISSNEFSNILYKYGILYSNSEVEFILNFLEIPNIKAFTLREFDEYFKACKIMEADIELTSLFKILQK